MWVGRGEGRTKKGFRLRPSQSHSQLLLGLVAVLPPQCGNEVVETMKSPQLTVCACRTNALSGRFVQGILLEQLGRLGLYLQGTLTTLSAKARAANKIGN